MDLKTAMCAKCDKVVDVVIETPRQTDTLPEEEMMTEKKNPGTNYDDGSKKIGEYLLQGWCMKETSCSVCLFPHMESRQGELLCVNCGPVATQQTKKQQQQSQKKNNDKYDMNNQIKNSEKNRKVVSSNADIDGFYQIKSGQQSTSKTSTVEKSPNSNHDQKVIFSANIPVASLFNKFADRNPNPPKNSFLKTPQ